MKHSLAILVFVSVVTSLAAENDDAVSYRLSTPRTKYLVGEPVTLNMQIENRAKEPLQSLYISPSSTEFRIEGARVGQPKVLLSEEDWRFENGTRTVQRLDHGKSWCFTFRLGHSLRDKRTFLVWPDPGRYELSVRYPWEISGTKTIGAFRPPEKTVTVEIVKPTGKDEEVWKMLWHREVIARWTDGFRNDVRDDDDPFVFRTCEAALRLHPQGGYAGELKRLLLEYYARYPEDVDARGNAKRDDFRKLTGWKPPPETFEPFPEDKRLDKPVTVHYPNRTPWPEVFADLTKQSDVSLRVAPDLEKASTSMSRRTVPLREIVRKYHRMDGVRWFKEGEGYVLKRVPPEPPHPDTISPPYARCPNEPAKDAK